MISEMILSSIKFLKKVWARGPMTLRLAIAGLVVTILILLIKFIDWETNKVHMGNVSEKRMPFLRSSTFPEKMVHIDLKGMPPNMKYFKKLFVQLKSFGVTSVLLEYEDMFPYSNPIAHIASLKPYSRTDIQTILRIAEKTNIQVVPLVQTFGHMEFVLKQYEFRNLRELPSYPQVLCPSRNESLKLVETMLSQVIKMHPGIKYLHIGCDEVFHIGKCQICSQKILRGTTTQDLFLSHVNHIMDFLRHNFPWIRPMIWDDEFRKMNADDIYASNIGKRVDLVVWNYANNVESHIPVRVLDLYSKVFESIWIGTAFKGAIYPDTILPNVTQYLINHLSWTELLKLSRLKPKGIVLTGWQRYDHFSVLCELLPVAIPSLVACLRFLEGSKTINEVTAIANDVLGCQSDFHNCHYVGSKVLDAVLSLVDIQESLSRVKRGPVFRGWLDGYNLEKQYSNPTMVERTLSEIAAILDEIEQMKPIVLSALEDYFPSWSVKEWMDQNFYPLQRETNELFGKINKLSEKLYFPRRPLDL